MKEGALPFCVRARDVVELCACDDAVPVGWGRRGRFEGWIRGGSGASWLEGEGFFPFLSFPPLPCGVLVNGFGVGGGKLCPGPYRSSWFERVNLAYL